MLFYDSLYIARSFLCLLSMGTSCTDFLSLLVPRKDPAAFAAGDGTVGDANDLANVRDAHCLQRLPLGIADVIERITLRHEEVTAPAFEFTHAAARQATVQHCRCR